MSVKHVTFRPFTSALPSGFLHDASAMGPWQSAATGLPAAYCASTVAVNTALSTKSTHVPWPPARYTPSNAAAAVSSSLTEFLSAAMATSSAMNFLQSSVLKLSAKDP